MRTLAMLVAAGAVAVGALFLSPADMQAQDADCGLYCDDCHSLLSTNAFGVGPPQEGDYLKQDYDCVVLSNDCPRCGGTVEFAADDVVSADAVVTAMSASAPRLVAKAVKDLYDRLFLDEERGLLVVRGLPCDDQAVASVILLDERQRKQLSKLGLRGIDEVAQS